MGSIYPRNDILQFDFRYKGQRCRETSGLQDTPANRRKCDVAIKRIEAEIVLGTFDYAAYFPDGGKVAFFRTDGRRVASAQSGCPCFAAFANIWFAEKKIEWRRSYYDTIRISLDKYLIPAFGDSVLSDIDKQSIMTFRAGLSAHLGQSGAISLSPARINKIMLPLRMILTEAADRYNFTSPWRNIKPVKEQRSDVDPFTIEEVNKFLETVRPDMRNYYAVRFFTGLRSSEIDGLKWKNVDFTRKEILVREALVQGRIEQTKTDGSRREIAMNHLVYEALENQRSFTEGFSDYVFCMRSGNPFINRNVTSRIWYPTLRHLGLRPRRPYQTRHTAATLWLASGENPEWIARQMGHSTTEMLFRVYSRYVPNLTRQDGSAFDRLLRANFG